MSMRLSWPHNTARESHNNPAAGNAGIASQLGIAMGLHLVERSPRNISLSSIPSIHGVDGNWN
jgi:hypothetical protein